MLLVLVQLQSALPIDQFVHGSNWNWKCGDFSRIFNAERSFSRNPNALVVVSKRTHLYLYPLTLPNKLDLSNRAMHHSFRDVIHVQRVEQQIAELVNEFSN
jgi:hypothetical protein